jgi:CubicO group peptidase (beta-lactamase class C family)
MVAIITVGWAQPSAGLDAEIDAYLRAHVDANGYMGTVLVARGDEVLFEGSYGFADLEHQVEHTRDSVFRIGSLTKQFTATAVLDLAYRGLVQLDDPLARYLPEPSWSERVTVREVLHHTSGVPDYTSLPGFAEMQRDPHALGEILATVAALPLEFDPGSRFAYSNSGYVLLAAVIERASGRDYATYLRERLLGPLELRATAYDDPREVVPHRVDGYMPSGDGVRHAPVAHPSVASGAGALRSTAEDLFRWERALQRGDVGAGISLEDMLVEPVDVDAERGLAYGYGWYLEEHDGRRLAFHGGATEGFMGAVAVDPNEDVTVVVLSNVALAPSVAIARDLVAIVQNEPYEAPAIRESIAVDDSVLRAYVGRYRLTPEMIAEVTLEDGRLYIDPDGQGRYQLHAASEVDFFLREGDVEVTFVRSDDGAVDGLLFRQAGREVRAQRLE